MSVNLYMWTGEGVLHNYQTGVALALAESPEQARELLTGRFKADFEDTFGPSALYSDDENDMWLKRIAFLLREPECCSAPFVYYLEGGD